MSNNLTSTSAQSSDIPEKPEHRGAILAALMVTMMLAAMDTTVISTAIPQIVGDLGGFSYFSWVYSIYLLAQTITIPIYGKLADLYGRKPILLFGTVIFLIGSALCAAAWDMPSLISFRAVQGLGAGSILATVNTLAGDIYSVRERAKIQGWLSSVWGMAAILGPSLGGAFVEYATWHWIFLVNLPIGAVSIFLIAAFLTERFEKHVHHIDFAGAGMMLITGIVLIYTLMQLGDTWSITSVEGISMILLSIVLVIATIYIEKKSVEPIMPLWVWRNRTLLGGNLAVLGLGAMMIGPNMYVPIYSQSVLQLGAIASGFVLASLSLGWPVASSFSGILYLKIDFRNTAIIGAILVITSSVGFVMLPFEAPVWLVVINQTFMGAGFGLLSTPTLVGVQSIVGWQQRGVVTGANMFTRYLGQSIGASILGGIFNATMRDQLTQAPQEIQSELPQNVNDVVGVLQSHSTTQPVIDYLRESFYASSHDVFATMALIGVVTFLVLMLLPRKFPVIHEDR